MTLSARLLEEVNAELAIARVLRWRTRTAWLQRLAAYLMRRMERIDGAADEEEPAREGDPTDLYDYLPELGGDG
jgi:hypothetical protein